MAKINPILLIVILSLAFAYPVASISRWFSSTYADLHYSLKRYSHCVSSLEPINSSSLNSTEYLIKQIHAFLNETNYDNEQLANITMLMDSICQRGEGDSAYPISMHLNVDKYSNNVNGTGKAMRCKAMDQIMDSMYEVLKRSSVNSSQPLDFSSIKYYTDQAKQNYYSVVDLINTSWIKSEVHLESVCHITDSVKGYVLNKMATLKIASRVENQNSHNFLIELFNSLCDTFFGMRQRASWESSHAVEQFWARLSGLVSRISSSANRTTTTKSSPTFVTSTTPLPRATTSNVTVNSTLVPHVAPTTNSTSAHP